jgi:hypothetical protein
MERLVLDIGLPLMAYLTYHRLMGLFFELVEVAPPFAAFMEKTSGAEPVFHISQSQSLLFTFSFCS